MLTFRASRYVTTTKNNTLACAWLDFRLRKSRCIIGAYRQQPSTSKATKVVRSQLPFVCAVQVQAWFGYVVSSVLSHCVFVAEECKAWCSQQSSTIPSSLVNVCACIVCWCKTKFISGKYGDGVTNSNVYCCICLLTQQQVSEVLFVDSTIVVIICDHAVHSYYGRYTKSLCPGSSSEAVLFHFLICSVVDPVGDWNSATTACSVLDTPISNGNLPQRLEDQPVRLR